ncbi:ABC transporter permease [Marinobacter hydrocarbonoclasticus]|nr:ABC transporter permease [Marinobacter nauticus]
MLVKLAWRNLWRNKVRTAIMLGAMTFGLVGVVVMVGFITGLYGNMIQNAIAWQTSHLQVQNTRYLTHPDIQDTLAMPDALARWLDSQPDITAWSGRFIADGMVASARSTRGIRINGVIPAQEAVVTPVASHIIEGAWLDEQGRNPVVLSAKTAERLRLKVNTKVVLTFTDPEGEVTGAAFRVRGIYRSPISAFDDANLFVRQSDLTQLAHMQGVHELAILTRDGGALPHPLTDTLKQQLGGIAGPDAQVRDWQTVQPMLAAIISQMGVSNAIILGIYVLAMSFGIVNVMLMSVFERTREFGVLMAVGMTKPRIFALILLEASLLGLCGGALGVTLAYALMGWLGRVGIPLGSMADGLSAFGADSLLYPQVAPSDYLMVLLTVLAASLLSALYPARQILKQRPVDAMAQRY